jgi:8-oxo-dGTP pyrophosphatase MutT (NUDIX family)
MSRREKGAGTARQSEVGKATQIGALPVRMAEDGSLQVLLITSRETKRWVIPKGWRMKGLKDCKAAAREAQEEAGLLGEIRKEPIGSSAYWKRRSDHFDLCQVDVYLLEVRGQLEKWREKDQRQQRWFSLPEAADRVDEPGLGELIENVGQHVAPATGPRPAA